MRTKVLAGIPFTATAEVKDGNLHITVLHACPAVFREVMYGCGFIPGADRFFHGCVSAKVILHFHNSRFVYQAVFMFQSAGRFCPRISTNSRVGSPSSALMKCRKRARMSGFSTAFFHSQ